jgi:hypothetical protein
MVAGVLQLVAYGNEDLFLTRNAQITFFKVKYRRHTNFSTEDVNISFITNPDFGSRESCIISGNADMISRAVLRVRLPAVPKITDANGNLSQTKFAWIKRIGHAMVKSVEIEIGGNVIDRHYGEWMHIFSQLTTRNIKDKGIDKLIGNVPELYEFTNGKDEYTLYIPLYFWFCRKEGLALPLVALQFSEVRINVEFYELDRCYSVLPTHCIKTVENVVNFKQGEYIYQKGDDNIIRHGIFSHFDILTKKLYYTAVTKEKLIGVPYSNTSIVLNTNLRQTISDAQRQAILSTPRSDRYTIKGMSSEYIAKPDINVKSLSVNRKLFQNLKLKECKLMVEYVYIDSDERQKLVNSKLDYLIEQLYFTPNEIIASTHRKVKIVVDQPCKLMVWLAQYDYIDKFNDRFNYTDTHVTKQSFDTINTSTVNTSTYLGYEENKNLDTILDAERVVKYDDIELCESVGNSLIQESDILLYSQSRLDIHDYDYYNKLQPYQFCTNSLPQGCNAYSFAIDPFAVYPTGTTNMGQIDQVDINLLMNYDVSSTRCANYRNYALCYNILRFNNGLCAPVFIR